MISLSLTWWCVISGAAGLVLGILLTVLVVYFMYNKFTSPRVVHKNANKLIADSLYKHERISQKEYNNIVQDGINKQNEYNKPIMSRYADERTRNVMNSGLDEPDSPPPPGFQ